MRVRGLGPAGATAHEGPAGATADETASGAATDEAATRTATDLLNVDCHGRKVSAKSSADKKLGLNDSNHFGSPSP
ncbi:hypothetical protein BST14_02960 [Mycobacterium arosiense ATCC BAA-1401 = DSM 45069]|uniref:Uncharacterized protein n=1 Tax=Mycobacterium arosiense ATCC BAA-1401 = DSM 45069 TaxID=1265311 RepID=A0A1W9ZQJ0_MYCAI|nr:hypothetical protein BST14_02960 [Mycobacterium arosiense ATCC BAA-1401 = DSM 45069]